MSFIRKRNRIVVSRNGENVSSASVYRALAAAGMLRGVLFNAPDIPGNTTITLKDSAGFTLWTSDALAPDTKHTINAVDKMFLPYEPDGYRFQIDLAFSAPITVDGDYTFDIDFILEI